MMGYRPGDETETFEAKITHKSAKSYLIEMTLGGRYFVPFSQIVGDIGDPDEDGNRTFEVTKWWFDKKEEVPER